MKPHINVITLAVENLERSVAFYRDGLGWKTEGIVGTEFDHAEVAFFALAGGLQLALFPRDNLAHASGLDVAVGGPVAFNLGYNVNDASSVDAETERVRAAGATIVREPHMTSYGGYLTYFKDPDGHLWEIVYVPSIVVEDQGTVSPEPGSA